MAHELHSFIDGEWVAGTQDEVVDRNPTRPDEVIAHYRNASAQQLERAADAAQRAFPSWRHLQIQERAAVLARAAALLQDRVDEYGAELTREEGKTLVEGRGEVQRAVDVLGYYAAEANQPQGEIYGSARPGEQIWTVRVPVGPTALITPWNFPIAIPAWKIAPALLYGNTFVWKPSEVVPLLAVRLMETFEGAGLPRGVGNLVLAEGPAGSDLIERSEIAACSFTGSTAVGTSLIVLGARSGTKIQAEMGGKNAAIVLEDADVERAVSDVVSGAMKSAGQKCTATSRVVVAAPVHEAFVDLLAERVRGLRVGDPMDPGVDVGPLASEQQLDKVLGYFDVAVQQGAHAVAGGGRAHEAGDGYFVQPSVFTDVAPDHRVFTEEVFGPAVAVVAAKDFDEALLLSNHGDYGLSGAIFTHDLGRVMEAVERFDVGVLHVNSETPGADFHVPFGGVKASGTSHREMGRAARDFFTEIKTVYVRAGTAEFGAVRPSAGVTASEGDE